MPQRSIDTLSIRRPIEDDVPAMSISNQQVQSRPKSHPEITKSPKTAKKNPDAMRFTTIAIKSFTSAWQANHFHVSLLRTIFSVRAFVFSILPIIYFQLQSTTSLRPDELLSGVQSVTNSTQTSYYITLGGVLLAILFISWLADMIATPTLMQLTFLQADKRKLSVVQSLTSSIDRIHYHFGVRLWHGLQIIITFSISLLILLVSQQFATTLQQQLAFGLVALLVIFLLWSIEESLRWTQNGYLATVTNRFGGVLSLVARQFFHRPLAYLGYGFIWLVKLLFVTLLVFLVVLGEISLLNHVSNFGVSVAILALGTTIIYLIWTLWYGFSCNFWALLIHERTPSKILASSIRFGANTKKLQIWPIVLVVTILALLILAYFMVAIISVDSIINSLRHASDMLPKSLHIVLPKPN